jgi:dTDP-4-dehydrorhamnose reductase
VNEKWLEYVDVRDLKSILDVAKNFNPHLIMNLAALTDLEYCETNCENAWLTNGLGQENSCLVAKLLNIPIVYISTAGIFDGEKEEYNDFDKPEPLSVYGKSKYYGETITKSFGIEHFIFRAGWMMGGGVIKDKKFINKMFKQIKEGKKELFIIDDKLGTPTYTVDFANAMFKIIETDFYGLYNMACSGSGSRFDVATEFLKCLGVEEKVKITIVGSDYFSKEYFAPRPKSEKLVNLKLSKRNLTFMRDWKECLLEYSEIFKKVL